MPENSVAYRAISSEQDVQRTLEQLSKILQQRFRQKPRETKWNDSFDDPGTQYDLSGYWINLWVRGGYKSIALCGKPYFSSGSNRLLEATVWNHKTGFGRTAGALVKRDSEVLLLHDGRATPRDGRPGLKSSKKETVEGKEYYVVGNIFAEDFPANLIRFHESRVPDSDLIDNVSAQTTKAIDVGPLKGCERSACVVSAAHSPVTNALLEALRKLNFKPGSKGVCQPDLFGTVDGVRYLFEVKPFPDAHSLMAGIGQLLVYSKELIPDRLFLVTSDRLGGKMRQFILDVCADRDIGVVLFSQGSEGFSFPTLTDVLR